MTKPYPMELRVRAVRFVEAGESRHAVAERLGVSASCVIKWLARYRDTGSVKPGKMGGHVARKIAGTHREWVPGQIASGGDVTLQGLADGLAARGVKVGYRTVWNFVHREGKSFKKTVHGAEQARPGIARRRSWWRKYQNRIDPSRLVFIDETWTKTNMAPLRGWGERGRRLKALVPHGHWKTLTFLAALRHDAITAPCVFDGPINGESFLRYVEQFLLPTLKPGDVVIIDNLGSHKAEAVRAAIKPAGARLLFLPAYSPDLNPIEQVFAKLKHLLRKAKERTVEATWQRIGSLLQCFTPAECSNYFVNAGYGST